MKNGNRYIYLLLFCLFIQNNTSFVNFLTSLVDSKEHLSLFLKNSDDTPAEEEKEEKEQESKESENKENENKENENKEKELKNIKYLNSFVFLSITDRIDSFRQSEDAKLFSSITDIETPPPKALLTV